VFAEEHRDDAGVDVDAVDDDDVQRSSVESVDDASAADLHRGWRMTEVRRCPIEHCC